MLIGFITDILDKVSSHFVKINNYDIITDNKYSTALTWQIEGLSWDPAECGTKKISLPREKIWVPDIVINEFMDENRAPETYYVYVTSTGLVFDGRPFHVISSCRLDIYTFPFDFQNCSYTFNSYKHSRDMGHHTWPLHKIPIFQVPILLLEGQHPAEFSSNQLLHTCLEVSSESEYLSYVRNSTLYVVNLLIPSSFLLSLDLFSFLLPPQSVDRASFKMTLILGYTVFLLLMNDLLPVTGNNLPLINVFFSLCLALMVASLLETILITNVLCGSRDFPPLPRWLRILVLKYLARLSYWCSPDIGIHIIVSASPPRVWEQCLDEMKKMSKDLLAIRHQVEEHFNNDNRTDEWIMFGQVIDRVLFIMYTLFIIVSLTTIMVLWLHLYSLDKRS
uniref:Neurotransmitter-gated ion-channel ligand-binding domain-containing protein n=1 Tax=Sinocyclocheilus grahami TaxID=75366 RepID=A0A672N101_SINGR